jgi:diguanylate cyclase (GGDEF)-like protein/PAS domain S-box-containing protein
MIAALALGYATAYVLWASSGGASVRTRELASEAVFLPLNTLLTVVFALASRRDEASAAMRRALRCLSASTAMLVAGNLVALYEVAARGRTSPGSLADVCFILGYPLTMVALLSIPVGQRRMDRWKFVCDAGMVLSFAGLALWYSVLRPIAASSRMSDAVGLALLYPLADLLLLVGIVTIVLRRPLDDHRGAIAWLGVSTALMLVADLAFSLVVIEKGQRSLLGTDVLYLATYLTMMVSAELFWRYPAAGSARENLRLARIGSLLPFVAAGATYALLCVFALRQWIAPLSGAALGAVAVSLFLGARQLLGFRQNSVRVAEAAVRASEARFRSLVQHSSDLIFVLGADGVIQFASSSASRLLGYEPEALVGVELAALAHPDDVGIVRSFVSVTAQVAGVSPPFEWRLRGTGDTVVQVEAIGSNRLADEAVRGIVVNTRDVGERKALLDQLAHQAFHDPLTGLANRALFYDRVSHALALAHRRGRAVTVLFLDLDGFKEINDTLGHAEGDHLLRMIAARLRACARTTDTVARLGGDEFAVLVEDTAAVRTADRLIERIREQMAFPFTLAGRETRVSASIGSASAIGGEVDEVLRHADLAMYVAKRSEKGSHRAFDAAMLR